MSSSSSDSDSDMALLFDSDEEAEEERMIMIYAIVGDYISLFTICLALSCRINLPTLVQSLLKQ